MLIINLQLRNLRKLERNQQRNPEFENITNNIKVEKL